MDRRGRGGKGRGKSRGGPKSRGTKPSHRGRGGHFRKNDNRNNEDHYTVVETSYSVYEDHGRSDLDDDSLAFENRKRTLDLCNRELPSEAKFSKCPYSKEVFDCISEMIASLTIEQQMSYDFLVPVEPIVMEDKNNITEAQTKENKEAPEEQKKPDEDLNDWLDNLLG